MLVLNAHYVALRVVSARRAFSVLVKRDPRDRPVAEIVHVEDDRFVSYGFDDWCELCILQREADNGGNGNGHANRNGESGASGAATAGPVDWVRTVRFDVAVPRIIRVLTFNRVVRQNLRLNRRNVMARDGHQCQYCKRRLPAGELSLDHVMPRSLDGPHTWENVVCCCLRCNVRKGGRTPERAGMKLLRPPFRPKRSPAFMVNMRDRRYDSWRHFLEHVAGDAES